MEFRTHISTEYIPLSYTHAHIALYIPPKRERESEDTRTHAHPRQTDQTPSKSVMQGDHDDATTNTNVVNPNGGEKQAEIYTHDAPWLIYACNWSVRFCCCLLFYITCVSFSKSLKSFYWVVFSLSSSYNARIESDAIRKRMDICAIFMSPRSKRSFFCISSFRQKKDDFFDADKTPLSLSLSWYYYYRCLLLLCSMTTTTP